jgi:hypothetical protein
MAVVVVMVSHHAVHVAHDDPAVILTAVGARRIVVGERWRGEGRKQDRADGGDQETLHSFFL